MSSSELLFDLQDSFTWLNSFKLDFHTLKYLRFSYSKGVGKRKSIRYWDRINKATEDWMCLVSPENVSRWRINQGSFFTHPYYSQPLMGCPNFRLKKRIRARFYHTLEPSLFYRVGVYIFSQVKRQHQGSNQIPVSGNQSKIWAKAKVET